tara:strand:+ start:5413 stop:5643 length:231 start_codon:yes stop_codon:yes gene_type:complete
MEKVAVSRLRENLMVFLKKVEKGDSVTITSRGREVAKLVPLENKMKESKKILRQLGKNAVIGDIISPIKEKWKAIE